jgi:hypothetical protein
MILRFVAFPNTYAVKLTHACCLSQRSLYVELSNLLQELDRGPLPPSKRDRLRTLLGDEEDDPTIVEYRSHFARLGYEQIDVGHTGSCFYEAFALSVSEEKASVSWRDVKAAALDQLKQSLVSMI